MAAIVEFLAAAILILLACIGFTFFISSIWEKEKRASAFAGPKPAPKWAQFEAPNAS